MAAGIGHNRGPMTEGARWRAHCWTRARRELLGARLPVEIVRHLIEVADQAFDLGDLALLLLNVEALQPDQCVP